MVFVTDASTPVRRLIAKEKPRNPPPAAEPERRRAARHQIPREPTEDAMTRPSQNAQHLQLARTLADPIVPHAAAMIESLGEDPRRPGLADTPERFAKAMRYLTEGYEREPRDVVGGGLFPAEGEGMVLVRDVEFHSLCEHHMLPFFGRVHVAYLPGEKIIGLSKIPRIVDLYARRLQVQERITEQVADALMELLAPKGVIVVAEARHLCMAMRGVEKQHSATATRAVRGVYAHDVQARQEILSMIRER
jgi:GTP cyclohydrolase I